MKKTILFIVVVVAMGALFYFFPQQKSDALRIGLVVPVQNVALDDIVDGFKSEIAAHMSGKKIEITVQNAVGDINLQKSAFTQIYK